MSFRAPNFNAGLFACSMWPEYLHQPHEMWSLGFAPVFFSRFGRAFPKWSNIFAAFCLTSIFVLERFCKIPGGRAGLILHRSSWLGLGDMERATPSKNKLAPPIEVGLSMLVPEMIGAPLALLETTPKMYPVLNDTHIISPFSLSGFSLLANPGLTVSQLV